jgi:hypothetical protein
MVQAGQQVPEVGGTGSVSVAGLACYRPGHRSRLICRLHRYPSSVTTPSPVRIRGAGTLRPQSSNITSFTPVPT